MFRGHPCSRHARNTTLAKATLSGRGSYSFCCVKIRPRKACRYPNLRSFGWVSYDKVGVLYSGELGSRSEARASDLRSYPGLWWKRIKLYLYEGTKVGTLRGPAQLADLQGALCVPHLYFNTTPFESLARRVTLYTSPGTKTLSTICLAQRSRPFRRGLQSQN